MKIHGEFKQGWPVLCAAGIGIGLGLSPLPFYTIGVFIPHLLTEFGPMGWDAGFILNALAIYTFGAFAAAPIVGVLAARYGARPVALISIVTFGLSMMAIGLNNGSRSLYVVLWVLLAFSGAGTLPITFTRPVANWFKVNRGIALAIALIATGIFGALSKYFAQYIATEMGWRMAYFALGCLPLMIVLPMNLLALRDVDDEPARDATLTRFKLPVLMVSALGYVGFLSVVLMQVTGLVGKNGLRLEYILPFVYVPLVLIPLAMMVFGNLRKDPPKHASDATLAITGSTLGEALRDWRFWLLAIVFVPISYAVGAIIPNIERVLTASGMGMQEAVGLATLTGIAVLGGRAIGGYLIDRFWAPAVAFVFLASPAFALWLLAQPELSANTATIAILMIGFGAGVEYDFMAFIVSKYFGMRSYSAIYGSIYGFFALGAGLGPGIMSNLAEGRGLRLMAWDTGLFKGEDWSFTLTTAGIILFLSTLPLLLLGKYRYDLEEDD